MNQKQTIRTTLSLMLCFVWGLSTAVAEVGPPPEAPASASEPGQAGDPNAAPALDPNAAAPSADPNAYSSPDPNAPGDPNAANPPGDPSALPPVPNADPNETANGYPPPQATGTAEVLPAEPVAKVPAVLPSNSMIVSSPEHLEFVEIDPGEDPGIRFDPTGKRFLYVPKSGGSPYIYLTGDISPGYELNFEGQWLEKKKRRFVIKVLLPFEPHEFTLRLFRPNRTYRVFKFKNFWLKLPQQLVLDAKKIRPMFKITDEQVVFSQLYSQNRAITKLDVDASRHAKLVFRFFAPPLLNKKYEGWRFTIRNEQAKVVGELSRLGPPPNFFDWREVGPLIKKGGTYTYSLSLYQGNQTFEGPSSEFFALEGQSVVAHRFMPTLQVEPTGEMGYYFFKNEFGETLERPYIGADLKLILKNAFFARMSGNISLYTVDPSETLSFIRIGAGLRWSGYNAHSALGNPFFFHIDFQLSHAAQTFASRLFAKRFSQVSFLMEPHLVFGGQHYVLPFLELGTHTSLTQQRLAFGATYQYYIRPWSMRLGVGFSYDQILRYQGNPEVRYSVFRYLTQLSFQL